MTNLTDADREALVDSINHERDGLRAELIMYQQAMHKCIFVFVTIGGVAATIHFGKGNVPAALDDKPILLFLLSQVEFFLSLFGVALICGQSMHAGYISALEKRLNQLVGSKACFWESELVPHYMGHPRGSFFWANLFLIISLIVIFGVLAYAAGSAIDKLIYGVVLTLEFIIIVALVVFSQLDTVRIAKFAESRFSGTDG